MYDDDDYDDYEEDFLDDDACDDYEQELIEEDEHLEMLREHYADECSRDHHQHCISGPYNGHWCGW